MAISDIASKVRQADSPPPWRTCQVCHALRTQPPAEAAALRDLLASGERYTDIERWLRDDPESPNLHRDALRRHTRGDCGAREQLR